MEHPDEKLRALAEATAKRAYGEARTKAGLWKFTPPWSLLGAVQKRMFVWVVIRGMETMMDQVRPEDRDDQRH